MPGLTTCNPLRFALSADSTTASFATKVPLSLASGQATGPALIAAAEAPSTSGFFRLGSPNLSQSFLKLHPIVTNADGETMSFRVWGWSLLQIAGVPYLWPTLLGEFVATAGNIAAGYAADTFLADTITLTNGDATINIISPANNTPASVHVDLRGYQYWQFDGAVNSGTGVAINAVWSLYS